MKFTTKKAPAFKWRLTSFIVWMEVSGHPCALGTVHPWKEALVPIEQKAGLAGLLAEKSPAPARIVAQTVQPIA